MEEISFNLKNVKMDKNSAREMFMELSRIFTPEIINERVEASLMKTRHDAALEVCRMIRDFHNKRYVKRSEEEKQKEILKMAQMVDRILPR